MFFAARNFSCSGCIYYRYKIAIFVIGASNIIKKKQ